MLREEKKNKQKKPHKFLYRGWVATRRRRLSISTKSLDVSVCPCAFWCVFLSTLFATGSCCIIYFTIDSHILPRTPISLPLCAPFALRLLPSSLYICLALTHLLLLIDLMSLLRSLFVSPTSSPHSFLPPSSQCEGASLHHVGLH